MYILAKYSIQNLALQRNDRYNNYITYKEENEMKKDEITEVLMTYLKSEVKNDTYQNDNKIFITLKNHKFACINVQIIEEN